MARNDDPAKLKIELETTLVQGKLPRALAIARELEALEPTEGRWAQKTGEILRRQGKPSEAAEAYERAARVWARQGFLARAIAMAKTLLALDPSRRALLEELDPSAAQREHRKARPQSSGIHEVPIELLPVPTIEPASEPTTARAKQEPEPSVDAPDEAPPASMVLDLSELEFLDDAPPEPSQILFFEESAIDHLALMPSFPLFAELPKEALAQLAEGAELVELEGHPSVFRRGDPADALYAIVSGAAEVDVPGTPLLREGDVFGEACLTPHRRRTAEVRAHGALVALRIPKALLDEVAPHAPALERVLIELLGRRLLTNALATSPLFAPLSWQDRRALGQRFELRRVPPRVPLLARGKVGDGLYLVLSDVVEVELSDDTKREVGPGALLGQRALIARQPSDITARAPRGALVLRLTAERFAEVVSTRRELAAYLRSLVLPTDAPTAQPGWG